MDKKTNLYICKGCEIGKCINCNALVDTIKNEFSNIIIKQHKALCNSNGIQQINDDIKNDKPEVIIIGACSPRVHTNKFSFQENVICERINLREQLAWSHKPNDENTQMLAEDMLRMTIAKTQKISIPIPYIAENLSSELLIVGGGITGITAAIEASKAGYKVTLIEKENVLGGWSNNLYKQASPEPGNILIEPVISEKIDVINKSANIIIKTNTLVKSISGEPGAFDVTLLNGTEEKIRVGAIVTATGWQPYEADKLKEYNYSSIKNVITNIEFEKIVKENKLNGSIKDVLFIQCAGSRDENHLPYCSNYCCITSLKQAKYVRELIPDSRVFIIYKDIRTIGMYEEFYKTIQNDESIFFTKGDIEKIEQNDNRILVKVKNSLIEEKIQIEVDLVVLATGMTPSTSEDLNLTYRKGKGLPQLKYNFPDSHFICFPYETSRTGIYAAGTVRAPMNISSCIDDASGAALKAIQCIEATKRGESVHPRSGDKSYPQLYMDRCTDCKRCTEECPFGMYDETEKGTPLPNPARCRRCGICMGACPERIINFEDYSIDAISSMIKAINIPDEFEEKPRVLAFVCENDAYPAFDMAGIKKLEYSAFVRVIPVRCIGSVNKIWINDALSHGFDGILQIGCKPGEDYQCHFIQGSDLTETRAVNFQETLESMMLEPERIKTEFIEINEYNRIPEIIEEYMEIIEEIGPNPFKGM